MEIKLRINGQETTYTQDFISGRMFRRTIEMQKRFSGGAVDETALDSMVDYVVDLFGGQFTRDQYYDGIEAKNLIKTVVDCINTVVGKTSQAVGAENNPNG